MSSQQKTVTLLGDGNIYEIDSLLAQIKGELDSQASESGALELDLGQIGDVDATFCQLLVVALADAKTENVALSLKRLPGNLINLIKELHLEAVIQYDDS